jgi:hypothetical protein
MRFPTRRKGLVLLSAILVSFAIVLFVASALRLTIGNLRSTQKGSRQAALAADSGLQYVQSRLSEDPLWDADGGLVVNTPELVVFEHRGNIVGLVAVPEGGFAQFRIRFNYQDDSTDDEDGYPDPAPQLFIDSPYVSVNNLFGGAAKGVPRARGSDWAVESASPRNYSVPGHSVCVIAEGRYGPGLSPSPSEINPPLAGSCATRVIEAYLEPGELVGDTNGFMSAGDTTFKLDAGGLAEIGAKDPRIASRLRSRSDIRVLGGASPNLVSEDENGETYTPTGTITADQDGSVDLQTELVSTDFYKLEWDQVRKATSSDPTIKGGTYTVWDDGTIHYYDMSYAAFTALMASDPANPGGSANLPTSLTFNNSESKLTIRENLFVEPSVNGTTEFNFLPRAGVQEDPPGAIASLPNPDKIEKIFAELGEARLADFGGGTIGGIGAEYTDAIWTLPVPPGTNLEIEVWEKNFFIDWFKHGIYLKEVSPGVGELTIDDGDGAFSQFSLTSGSSYVSFNPRLNDDQNGALLDALERVFAGFTNTSNTGKLDQILTQTVTGSTLQEFDFGASGVAPTLRADNIKVEFAPPEGETAILTAEGGVRFGAVVIGEGGSITSEDTIRVVGTGSILDSSLANGLTLYAKKNVVFSSLAERVVGSNEWYYKDLKIKGVVYAWGGVEMKLGSHSALVTREGDLAMEGAIVAYGGDPANDPGDKKNGTIRAEIGGLELRYNPAYFYGLVQTPPPARFHQTLYNPY